MTFFGRTPAASPEFTPPATVQSIAVLGAGSWGTAFAKIAADAARERGDDTRVTLIGRDEQVMAECERTRENARYFPGMKLPDNMHFTADAPAALTGADIVVLALLRRFCVRSCRASPAILSRTPCWCLWRRAWRPVRVCACRRSLPRSWKRLWLCAVLMCARSVIFRTACACSRAEPGEGNHGGGAYRLRGCGSYPAGG